MSAKRLNESRTKPLRSFAEISMLGIVSKIADIKVMQMLSHTMSCKRTQLTNMCQRAFMPDNSGSNSHYCLSVIFWLPCMSTGICKVCAPFATDLLLDVRRTNEFTTFYNYM